MLMHLHHLALHTHGARCTLRRCSAPNNGLSTRSRASSLGDGKYPILIRHHSSSCAATGFGSPEYTPEAAPGADPGNPVVPAPPNLENKKSRASWNATSVAFLGDAVWELYIRRHCFAPPKRVTTYYENVVAQVRAEQQEVYFGVLTAGDFLTDEERNVLKWGENSKATTPARFSKSGAHGRTYKRATALECLIGWEYLENPARLHQLMCHLGLG